MELMIVCFITFILTLSIFFEFGREYLKESTAEVFQPILTSLYSELTLLGFIGLLLFAITKLDCLKELSLELFHEEGTIQELGEQVHMVLFLVMMVFLLQAVAMGRFGDAIQRKWHLWEAKPLLGEKDVKEKYRTFQKVFDDVVRPRTFWDFLFQFKDVTEKHRMLVHTAARLKFVEESGLKASDFDFARYLSVALGVALGELVEVPVKTWFVLEFVLLFFWRCELAFGPNMRVALWILTGYVTATALYVVHAKIKLILHTYAAPLVRSNHHHILRGHNVVLGGNNTAAAPPKQRKTTAEADPEAPSSPRVLLKTRSTSAKELKLSKKTTSWFLGIFRRRREEVATEERTSLLATTQQTKYTPPREDDSEEDAPEYHALFWFGRRMHSHFTFDVIRLVSLLTSIYAAIFVLVYFDDLVVTTFEATDISPTAEAWRARGGRVGGTLIFLIAAIPPVLVVEKMRSVLEDFTVAANIAEFKNRRYVEQVLRRQKSVAAFEALKVVQCFRHPEMLELVLKDDEAQQEKQEEVIDDRRSPSPTAFLLGASSHTKGLRPSMLMSKRRASYRALAELQADDEEYFLARQRVHWHRIFDLFDDDKSGSITVDELRALLVKFKCDPLSIDNIVTTLDANDDGDVVFDEFFDFATKLTKYLDTHCNPKELTREMFALIDDDDSGTITVHEMHNVVADMLGQDLSVEDVFNVIQDIDVDGNGELDLIEFTILLDRLGIYSDYDN